jgi:hypothetical protein
MRRSGRNAVTAPRTTAQAERTDLPRRLASGIVREPTTGTKTVRRVMSSAFMVEGQVYFRPAENVKNISAAYPQDFQGFIRERRME